MRTLSNTDVAYGCFAFTGLTSLVFGLLALIPDVFIPDFVDSGGYGIVVVLNMIVVAITAACMGVAYTLYLRHGMLVFLSILSILFVLALFGAFESREVSDEIFAGSGSRQASDERAALLIYGTTVLLALLMRALWRRRQLDATGTH
jgi:hypothetical protein